jgi:HD-GYP domain-containing protein (c-di-GMP phosphodiesterase class II)
MDQALYIPLNEVQQLLVVGEAMPFSVVDAYGRLLLGQGRTLVSQRQIDMLIDRDGQVDRALAEAVRIARGGAVVTTAASATLFDRWEQLVWTFDDLGRRVVRHEAQAAQLVALVDDLSNLVVRDVDVALFLCMRQDDHRFALYALTHSLHTTVLVLLTARQMGWAEPKALCAARAALTMNISMLELQATMAEQDTAPTGRQLEQIRAHPALSAQMLRQVGVQDADWLAAVEDHHEQTGGGGYPRGTTEVTDIAQLIRAADVFMAKISPRAKRPPMAAQLASRQLFQQQPGAPLAIGLIKAIGVHPPGSLVQLQSGEVAVVTRRPVTGRAAQVATLSNRHGQPSIDTHRRDTAAPEFAIKAAFTDTALFPRVLPERVFGLVPGF